MLVQCSFFVYIFINTYINNNFIFVKNFTINFNHFFEPALFGVTFFPYARKFKASNRIPKNTGRIKDYDY